MSLIRESIPNLIGGVSQQPFSLRTPNQHESQVNAAASPVSGLTKRPNTAYVATLGSGTEDAYIHTIVRDRFEKYLTIITDGDLQVFDIDGNEISVAFPDGKGYLNTPGDAEVSFVASTFNDYTAIANRSVTAEAKSDLSPGMDYPTALLWVRSGAPETSYSVGIHVDGESYVSKYIVTTAADYQSTTAAAQLHAELDGLTIGSTTLTATLLPSGTAISLQTDGADFEITAATDNDAAILAAIKTTVPSTDALPKEASEGFRVTVRGETGAGFAKYYLQFTGGVWTETIKHGLKTSLDPATLPHILVRESDGTFTFRQAEWEDRDCGDDETNPLPSFIGNPIDALFLLERRFGLVSQQNVVLSRTADYFNFGRGSATVLTSSDPIDVEMSDAEGSNIRHAIAFGGEALLFTDYAQYVLGSEGPLSPSSVYINKLAEHPSDLTARPVMAGNAVFAGAPNGTNEAVRQFTLQRAGLSQSLQITTETLTEHVPRYLARGIYGLSVNSTNSTLVVLSGSDRQTVGVYQWYVDANGDRAQAAWHKWTFNGDKVLYSKFIDSELFLVIKRGDEVLLESLRMEEGYIDEDVGWCVNVDGKIQSSQCSPTYDSGTDRTTYTLPYPADGHEIQVVSTGAGTLPAGTMVTVAEYAATKDITLVGDTTGEEFLIGRQYIMETQLSPLVVREEAKGGGNVNAITSGRLQIRKISINYADSGHFTVEVSPKRRSTFNYLFSGIRLGDLDHLIGKAAIDTGVFRCPIVANNLDVSIVIKNDSPMPSQLLNIEWEGQYTSRSRRYG